jgi:hypothetical protein
MTRLKTRHLYVAAAAAALAGAAIAIPAWADSGGREGAGQGDVESAPFPAPPPPGGVGFVRRAGQGPPTAAEIRRVRGKLDKFVQCMRKHGAHVPGVDTKGPGVSVHVPGPKAGDVLKRVAEKCGMPPPPPRNQLFPLSKKQIEQNREALDDFVKCMRSNGQDLPNRSAPRGGALIPIRPGSTASGFEKAQEKCGGPPPPPALPPRG